MATPPLPNETVELVEHEVAFQGYFRVGRYFFRHDLYQGGRSGTIRREVFERGLKLLIKGAPQSRRRFRLRTVTTKGDGLAVDGDWNSIRSMIYKGHGG